MFNYSNSKVTLELRDVLSMKDENGSPFKLWDFDYPSFYEGAAKTEFEQKVIDHYLFHQIGVETVARFKHNFKTRIREIMPYYIQYYKSVETMNAIDDPFGNVDIVETFEQSSTDTATGVNTESATSDVTAVKTDEKTASDNAEHKFSDTPQGSIQNLDMYMTEASVDSRTAVETDTSTETNTATGSNTATSEASSTGTITHTLTRKGNQGVNTYAHDMNELRQSFINVDMMVIGALRDLFLLIY